MILYTPKKREIHFYGTTFHYYISPGTESTTTHNLFAFKPYIWVWESECLYIEASFRVIRIWKNSYIAFIINGMKSTVISYRFCVFFHYKTLVSAFFPRSLFFYWTNLRESPNSVRTYKVHGCGYNSSWWWENI